MSVKRLGTAVYGEGGDAFAEMVGRSVRARGWRLAVSESCTGGPDLAPAHAATRRATTWLAARSPTRTAPRRGCSASRRTRCAATAPSRPRSPPRWREGVRRLCEGDVAISVTGIAGPTGGTATKPVGLFYWGRRRTPAASSCATACSRGIARRSSSAQPTPSWTSSARHRRRISLSADAGPAPASAPRPGERQLTLRA